MSQLKLNLDKGTHGGRRTGAGRKRIHSTGVAHRTREKVLNRFGLHVNFKVRVSIRNKDCLRILKKAIRNARTQGLRVIHFSLESNHVHLILEATSSALLTKGMRSLTITFAKGVKQGKIQLGRYHLHVLRTLRETRNAVHYVLFNHQKHRKLKRAYVDSYSSLGMVEDLKALAKESGITIVLDKIQEMPLDKPYGWMTRRALVGT